MAIFYVDPISDKKNTTEFLYSLDVFIQPLVFYVHPWFFFFMWNETIKNCPNVSNLTYTLVFRHLKAEKFASVYRFFRSSIGLKVRSVLNIATEC
jgi:hypothetical protein